MKKVSEDWQKAFPDSAYGVHFFEDFSQRARNIATEVFRVATAIEARKIIADLVQSTNAKKVVAVNSPLQLASGMNDELKRLGVVLYTTAAEIAEHAESADIGISTVEFGIAESGSVCMDGYACESRLVSMLPPLHIVFMQSNYVVAGLADAMEIIAKVYNRGYLSFISGPSRTSDIERVLTIGVHGPSRFVIIAVDEEVDGGEA